MQQDNRAHKNQNASGKETTNRHVYIDSAIEVNFAEDIRNEYKAANAQSTTHEKKQLAWTIVGAGLLFLTAVFTFWQGCTAHQNLSAIRDQTRPYVFTQPGIVTTTGVNPQLAVRQAFDEELNVAHQLTLDITVVNAGTSLAKMTQIRPTQIAIGKDAIEAASRCEVPYISDNTIIPPQGLNPVNVGMTLTASRTRVLGDDEILKLKTPHSDFLVIWYGELKYTSLTGGEYRTPYCFKFNPTGMPLSPCNACGELK